MPRRASSQTPQPHGPLLLLFVLLLAASCCCHAWLLPPHQNPAAAVRRRWFLAGQPLISPAAHPHTHTRVHLWKGWGLGGSNATANAAQKNTRDEEDEEEEEDERDSLELLGESGADVDTIIIDRLDDDEEEEEEEEDENDNGSTTSEEREEEEEQEEGETDSGDDTATPPPPVVPTSPLPSSPTTPTTTTATSKPMLTDKALQQLDDSSYFDGFEGFRGRKVSYSSQPKARHNIVFEVWRQRTPEDIAILYKGQHQYSASRRVQEAINEQVSTLLGMFLREPDFQSRLQIQGGQLANLFFKLQMMGYMFANADKVLSASSSLNLRPSSPSPPTGDLSGTLTVVVEQGKEGAAARNVTLGAKELVGSLVREVEMLREELARAKMTKEVARQSDLLAFIRSVPEDQQRALTENIPDYTLDCMRKLVDLALARAIPTVGNQWNPTTPVLIPSKAIFAELCIMQVVQGYLLCVTETDQAEQLKLFGGTGFPTI